MRELPVLRLYRNVIECGRSKSMVSMNRLCHSWRGMLRTSSITWEGVIEWICSAEKVMSLLSFNYLTFLSTLANDFSIFTTNIAVKYCCYNYMRGVVFSIDGLPHTFHVVATLAAYAGSGRWQLFNVQLGLLHGLAKSNPQSKNQSGGSYTKQPTLPYCDGEEHKAAYATE